VAGFGWWLGHRHLGVRHSGLPSWCSTCVDYASRGTRWSKRERQAAARENVPTSPHTVHPGCPVGRYPVKGSAAVVIVLIRKGSQPSGFTQNVQRTQRIVSGQGVMLQSLGVIKIHSPHDNDLDRRGQRARRNRT